MYLYLIKLIYFYEIKFDFYKYILFYLFIYLFIIWSFLKVSNYFSDVKN